jgi:hypothetical protein
MKQSIPGTLKRISLAEKNSYIELDIYSSEVCTKAIAFTLTDIERDVYPEGIKPPHCGAVWQQVTYYADQTSINNTPLYPLELMYKEWEMNKDITDERN